MEWKPIESAPKDGTNIILYFPLKNLDEHWERTIIGRWRESYWVFQGRAVAGYSASFKPTHWMPLPTPPNEGTSHDDA